MDTLYVAGPFSYDPTDASYVQTQAHKHEDGYTYKPYYLPLQGLHLHGWWNATDHALLRRAAACDATVGIVIDYLRLFT